VRGFRVRARRNAFSCTRTKRISQRTEQNALMSELKEFRSELKNTFRSLNPVEWEQGTRRANRRRGSRSSEPLSSSLPGPSGPRTGSYPERRHRGRGEYRGPIT